MDKVKSLLINHGEKLLAAVCALFGFLALTSAHWAPDNRNPLELASKADAAKASIAQNMWPEEEKLAFKEIKDVRALTAVDDADRTNPGDYAIRSMNPSLIRSREKKSAVEVVVATKMIADPLILILAMPPEEEEEEGAEDDMAAGTEDAGADASEEDKDKSEEKSLEDLMAQKYGKVAASTAGAMGTEGYPGAMGAEGYPGGSGGGYPGGGPGGAYPGGAGGGYPGGGPGMGSEEMMMMTSGGYEGGYGGGAELYGQYGSAMMSAKKRVRVTAGVSVRGIVNLQSLRANLRKSLHLGNDVEEAQRHIRFTDLLVERRQKLEGAGGFGEWEKVSSEDLGEILEDSFGIDRDVVNPAVTRNTITMPLPRRATGTWDVSIASHPDLEDFKLSEEEKNLIDLLNQKLTERLEEEKANAPVVVETKGFSTYVQSATDVSSMYGNSSSMYGQEDYESMYNDMESSMGSGPGGSGSGKLSAQQRELLDKTRATAENRLLLVRFMDFTVERGFSYQYRVRLEMKNPNYGEALDELVDPAVGSEPVLMSDWSEPTPEAFVPTAHRLYVADVESRSGRPESVKMKIYTDTTETGLPIMGKVDVFTGMPIAGMQKKEVVDLTSDSLEAREVELMADAVLAGAEEIPRFSTSDHPDLKPLLARLGRGETIVPSQVTIVDSDGQVKLRSIGDMQENEMMDEKEEAFILEQYEAWRPKAAAAGGFFGEGSEESSGGYESGMSGLGMSAGSSMAGGYFGGGGETGKKMSSRARSRAKREAKKSGAAGGPGGYMGAGGGYEGGRP